MFGCPRRLPGRGNNFYAKKIYVKNYLKTVDIRFERPYSLVVDRNGWPEP
jgi:hypothetical protein